ncbi:MAG TPA: universal stress protein [Gemmataceae bacterium]|nr:universal stress protein [Gemmataceae bacterium]
MTATVMAPLDGSPAAEAALPWAVHLAKRTNSSLRLVGVHAPPTVMLDGETLVGNVVPDESIRRKEADYFADVQSRLSYAGVPVTAELLDGSVVTSLADYARKLRPTWVVMLSHGRGAVARFFLGETASEFVRSSPCPVLLVHGTSEPVDLTATRDVRHVLVPLDGSELAARMLGPASDFARAVGADVTLLTALAAVPNPAEAAGYLEDQAKRVRQSGLTVGVRTAPQGGAADAIVAEAAAKPGTVVALTTHGRGGLSKLVWGSVTDAVVRRTPAPALVFRPQEK